MSTVQSAPAVEATAEAPSTTPGVFGLLSLVLGLASFAFGYTIVVPVAAVVLGIIGLRREKTGRGFNIWGIVLGGATIVLPILGLLLGIAVFAPLAFLAAL